AVESSQITVSVGVRTIVQRVSADAADDSRQTNKDANATRMGFASYSKRASQGVATVARAIHLIHLARAEPGRHLGSYQIIDSTRGGRSRRGSASRNVAFQQKF